VGDRVDRGLRSIGNVDLLKEDRESILDGALREHHLAGDLLIGAARGDELEDLHLGLGELPETAVLDVELGGHPPELGQHLASQRRCDHRAASRRCSHGAEHLIRAGGLQDVPHRASLERLEEVAVMAVHGQHDDLHPGSLAQQLASRRDPVDHAHADVHQDDVRLELERHLLDLEPVTGLADDLDV